MAEGWTPITDVVRQAVTFERNRLGEPRTIPVEAFDRWLALVKADALRAATSEFRPDHVAVGMLNRRADRIEKEVDRG